MKIHKHPFIALLSLGIAAAFSLPTLAATVGGAGTSQNVQGNLVGTGVKRVPDSVISVDLLWEDMTFTYEEGDKGDWDPEDHVYVGGASGTWSANKPEITLRNHSNVYVVAEFAFASADGVGAEGTFYQKQPSITDDGYTYTALKANEQSLTLRSAVGTEKTNPPTGAVCFGITSGTVTKDQTVGTVTVTVKKDPRSFVYSAEELVEAIENIEISQTGGTVVLGCDIDLSEIGIYSCFFMNIGSAEAPFVLDLGGNTLVTSIDVRDDSYVTIQNGAIDGRQNSFSMISVYVSPTSQAKLLLDHVEILAYDDDLALENTNGTVTIKDSVLHGTEPDGMMSIYNDGGSLTLEGTTTLDAGIAVAEIDLHDFLITLKTGGTYSINGKSVAVGQTDLTVNAAAVTAETYDDWVWKYVDREPVD